jgi:sugar porter (SP) family MFS transporter
MFFASIVLLIGVLNEIVGLNVNTLIMGRLIGGLGTGLMTNAIPLYVSEIAPADIRGKLISTYSLLSSLGQMLGYFVTFTSSYFFENDNNNWCWRTPWIVQLIIGLIFVISIMFLPLSPRWLIDQGRETEGLKVLISLRGLSEDHKLIQKEYLEIMTLIAADNISKERSYTELFEGFNLRRTLIAFFISIATSFTGSVVIWYYAPKILLNAGLDDVTTSLALSGGIGFLSLISTFVTLQYFIDRWGRRALFFVGSVISGSCMAIVGTMFYFFTTVDGNGDIINVSNKYAQYTIFSCIFIFAISFAGTWGVVNYVYTAEIFSTRCRAKGLSLTYAISWASSIVITYFIPYCFSYSVSGVYFFFAGCSLLTFIGICFIPETKGKSLEDIDFIFEGLK